ncbi:PRC-barrel domain-containing protein [Niveispirillum sp.]|uniref:PRC-barrel domain-containing protein n=1 Tax=Niveispirillum sp. TaxID=1917217 RepID=UPI001B49DFD6|nr:PRC-barrel domain-containing protein [Niveispirillum sp.]MBP7337847.1 PRC-barrel domain-containing protein [Niveispirillum sp.]
MKRFTILLAGFSVATLLAGAPAFAQGTPQTMALTQVDPTTLATGYRTSKVVGSMVYNAAGETVGTIDDLIVTPNDRVPFAVLSVGGFLGMGSKYVVVSYAALNVTDKKFILRDATKETLKKLPEFKYAS